MKDSLGGVGRRPWRMFVLGGGRDSGRVTVDGGRSGGGGEAVGSLSNVGGEGRNRWRW